MLAAGEGKLRCRLSLRICKSKNPKQRRDTSKGRDSDLRNRLYALVSH